MAINDLKKTLDFTLKIRTRFAGNFDLVEYAKHIHTQLVLSTPVDNGVAQSNWFVTLDRPSDFVDKELTDPSKSKLEIPKMAKSDANMFITNNLPYILALQNGWSQKAPNGFVPQAIQKARNNFLRGLKKRKVK